MINLATLLESSASRYPQKTAFTFGETNLSYAQLNGAANQLANGLVKRGIQPGDKVALSCLNLPYFPIVYFAILKTGAVVVPLSVLLKSDEVAYHLNNSDAKAYLCFEGTPELPMGTEGIKGFNEASQCETMIILPANPHGEKTFKSLETVQEVMKDQSPHFDTVMTSSDDNAVIIYTSGTTGKPKGAQLSHSNLFINAVLCADLFKSTEKDIQLIVLPLFHIFAMTCLMNAGIYRGVKNILLPRFDGRIVVDLLKEHKVSIFAGVPTMYWGLLNTKTDVDELSAISSNLRLAISGGASLPEKVLQDFESTFKVKLLEGYGMSEGSPVVTFNQTDVGTKANSIGTPLWGVQVKLVDNEGNEVPTGERGELLYKGHNVTKGYYKKPEANAEALKDGWLHSGDIAIKDEDGFFYIVDRKKDMILRGGLNVYPREIEELIMKHPAVSTVAVIGVPDEKLGEEIKAFVVLKEGKNLTDEALRSWTKERIANYKYPRIIAMVKSLPLSATGKILKKELRKL